MATLTTSINYTAPLELYNREKPFYSNVPAPDGCQSNQVAWKYDNIGFYDIRDQSKLENFNLDQNGFEIFQFGEEAQHEALSFDSESWIETQYYPVVERLLKARFGDVNVKIFDHTVSVFDLEAPCHGDCDGDIDNGSQVRKRVKRTAEPHDTKSGPARRQPSYSAHCGVFSSKIQELQGSGISAQR